MNVIRINGTQPHVFEHNKNANLDSLIKRSQSTDIFLKSNSNDAATDGKFTTKEALKNFGKGLISPLEAIAKHPIISIATVATCATVCSIIPVLTPILTVGFGALSFVQLGKGCYNAAKEYRNGNYDNSEKAFEQIGQGFISTALTVLGLKQNARVAAEAKTMSKLGTTTLDAEQKIKISADISNGNRLNALKEILSLFVTKEGRQAVLYQFKPNMIKARITDIINVITNKQVKTKKEVSIKREKCEIEKFKKTPEGLRRASLSDQQIEAEVKNLFNQAFDELDVPYEARPKLKIVDGPEKSGGSYQKSAHVIEYNPKSYKAGVFEMDDVIMHEATHCKEAIQRAAIPQDRANQVVKDNLISRIQNGESERIIVKGSLFGAETMTAPKMPQPMKKDFIRFANNKLYKNSMELRTNLSEYASRYYELTKSNADKNIAMQRFTTAQRNIQPILDDLNAMLAKYPEFVSQYDNTDEALNILVKYCLSHETRYSWFTDVNISRIPQRFIPKLSNEELIQAEKSLIDSITTMEGNSRISGINGLFASNKAFNQYQFSPEEVLAQQNGHKFLIKNLTAKLNEMRAAGTLTAEEEAFITSTIEKSKLIIEYKTKGLFYYQKYTELLNNPTDEILATFLKTLESELKALKNQISPVEYEVVKEFIEVMSRAETITNFTPQNIISILTEIKERQTALQSNQ